MFQLLWPVPLESKVQLDCNQLRDHSLDQNQQSSATGLLQQCFSAEHKRSAKAYDFSVGGLGDLSELANGLAHCKVSLMKYLLLRVGDPAANNKPSISYRCNIKCVADSTS